MSNPIEPGRARAIFLEHINTIIDHYAARNSQSDKDRCHGVALAILEVLDGHMPSFPQCSITLQPHPDDRAFAEKSGHDYFEADTQIGGALAKGLRGE